MGKRQRKMNMMFREIRQASMTSTLKRILRDEIRHKRLQTVTPKTPQLLQIASINDPKGIADKLPSDKLMLYAQKLQRRYLRAKKAMCKNCKGQAATTIDTTFKVDGHEEEVKMQAVIIDLNQLEVMEDSRIDEILTLN